MASLIIGASLTGAAILGIFGNSAQRKLATDIFAIIAIFGRAAGRKSGRTVFRGGGGRFKSTTCI